jgi:hypothetical protein
MTIQTQLVIIGEPRKAGVLMPSKHAHSETVTTLRLLPALTTQRERAPGEGFRLLFEGRPRLVPRVRQVR